jgi:hypothetical protein
VYVENPEGYGIEQLFTGIIVRPPLDEIVLTNVFFNKERNILGSDDNITVFM